MISSKQIIGKSVTGRVIERTTFTQNASLDPILVIGGVHGDEYEGVELLHRFSKIITAQEHLSTNVSLIPCLNPDGYHAKTRVNKNGVDLNRNLPTQDWTATPVYKTEGAIVAEGRQDLLRYNPGIEPGGELENQALIPVIKERKWKAVISVHSYEIPMVNYNGDHSESLANFMSQRVNLPAKADIGYPTPGSLGTWVGIELKIPCITLELPKDMKGFSDWTPLERCLLDVVQLPDSW
jgi:murein peptide amidase A